MAEFAKVDNHDPAAKLALRRYFLRKYHAAGPIRVLDCCQASGLLWKTLRDEFDVERYWGVDKKRKAGRLQIDNARLLAQPGWVENVVDIDTYGSPWKQWEAMLPNVVRPMTVFLTIGRAGLGVQCTEAYRAAGLRFKALELPISFGGFLDRFFLSYCLTRCCDFGILIVKARESASDGNARYIGVRLEPAKK